MSIEVKQLIIKSNISNGSTSKSKSEDDEQEKSSEFTEQHKNELLDEMKRMCSKLVKDELRRMKER